MNRQRYFLSLGLTTLAVLTAVVTLNYLIDPYFTHQWDTPLLKRPSPAQQKLVPWAKTYAAYRYQPEIVFLGSSRTEIGLPADAGIVRGKRVLNLAVSAASLGDAIRMLRHTSYFHKPEMVVWGLDYGWQFRDKTGNTDLTGNLVAESPLYPFKRFLLNLKRSLSMAMTVDTLKIAGGVSEQQCLPMLATYGHKSDQCLKYIMEDEGGAAAAFDKIITKGDPQGPPADLPGTMQLLDTVTREFCRQGTAFRFFLHPVHALAELSYWETTSDGLDRWKEELTTMTDKRAQEGCDIRLIDFSGFNSITTEPIPQQTGQKMMHHYWEHSHYRSEVGEKMLQRLLTRTPAEASDDFGVELNGATIARHLELFRKQRSAYCGSHPRETGNMRLCDDTPR